MDAINLESTLVQVLSYIVACSSAVQVMVLCWQTTRYYLSHCWPISLSPCGVMRGWWYKYCKSITIDWVCRPGGHYRVRGFQERSRSNGCQATCPIEFLGFVIITDHNVDSASSDIVMRRWDGNYSLSFVNFFPGDISHLAKISVRSFEWRYHLIDVTANQLWGHLLNKQRVLMHGHQGWNVRHGLCHIYMRYVYIYIWVVYTLCFFCCLFITVTWWYVWCFEWASGNQEEVQACLVTLWLFIQNHSRFVMLMIWK